jgi:ligand-binding sensor domain-containing protein/DNA-binding CsgD family transcriptional regulator
LEAIKYFSFTVFMLIMLSAHAQFRQIGFPAVTNYSRSDYQAGTQNWAIQQDADGILYFANNKGLLEFDGTSWQTYYLPNRTIVRSFTLQYSNRIYVGGQNEIGFLELNELGKKVYTSLTSLVPQEALGFEDVWKILPGEHGVFFCSEKAIISLQDTTVKVIWPPGGRFENFFDIDGEFYFQDKEKGLFHLQAFDLVHLDGSELLSNKRIVAIIPAGEKHIIITFSDGLFVMDNEEVRYWETAATSFLKENHAYCATLLSNQQIAIGTALNGLLIIEANGRPVTHLNKRKGLQNNTILCLEEDRESNLWLGLDNGIDYVELNSPFSFLPAYLGVEGTAYASIVHDGYLYLGTNQGLFYTLWDKTFSPLEVGKFKPVENASGQIWNLCQLGEDVIVCQHKGAAILDGGRAVPFSEIEGAWKFMELEGHPGFAIGGAYTGLYLYQQDATAVGGWRLVRKYDGFDESARIFEIDDDGNIWVAHAYKGLFKLTLSEDLSRINKLTSYGSRQGLPVDLLIYVAKIRNELVFTTPKGAYKYDQRNDQFMPYQELNDAFGEHINIHRLLEDETGNVWFSVNNSFGVLNVKQQGVFNELELMYFNQIQDELVDGFEHVYTPGDNNVFIGTESGFVQYDAGSPKNMKAPFEVLIRKLTSITDADSVIYEGSLENRNFRFPAQMNDFRFSYSAPFYEKREYVLYRFRLEGFEKYWSEWSSRTEKEYTNLSDGTYHFTVQAQNAYGQMSSIERFSFTIAAPWYKTIYAKAGFLILALIGIGGVFRYVSRREARKTEAFKLEQARKMEDKEAEFKKEVEKSEGEIIRLRNEKLQADIMHKNSQLASATMHLVQKSEIMMKLKSDLDALKNDAPSSLKKKIEQISRTIESDAQLDNNWEQFELYFDQVHQNFFKRLRARFPNLTPKDQKLCAYLRMNLTTKEIAPLLNISVRGVEISRYRLRKKLELDSSVNLVAFILEI